MSEIGGSPGRPIAAIPAVVLVLVSLWEVVATRCDATSVPDDDAWGRAEQVVRAGYRAGDLIVFAPDWIDPVGRMHLGDLIPIEMAARMDAARYARVWELSIRGARSPDVAGLDPIATQERGGVTIRRYERTPPQVLADVRDRLATAKVEGGVRPTLELAEVGFAPHRCIQAIAEPDDRPVRITFPELPLGDELVGYVGIADVFTRREHREPAHLDVEIDGHVVTSADAGVDDGWVRFATTTTRRSAAVTFVVRSAGASRQICFAAEARQ